MSEQVINQNFENVIIESFAVPPVSEEFVDSLYGKMVQQRKVREEKRFISKSIAFRFALALLAIFLAVFLIIGPQKVYAAIMRLFGYIPGVGVVSEDTDIRILAEPVSVTRDGITVSVNSMVLTPNETIVDFGSMGVPSWASANEGMEMGCVAFPYLLLNDGTEVDVTAKEAVPGDVWEATFVVPCIFGAYADLTPTDWRIPLTFVSAPDDYVILPVQDVVTETPEPTAVETKISATEAGKEANARLSIEKMIETENGYILVGKIMPVEPAGQIQQMGATVIKDADGNSVPFSFPENVNPFELMQVEQGEMTFAVEFAGAGVQFPITLEIPGVVVLTSHSDEKAQLSVNIPSETQAGENLNIQQTFNLAGHELVLETIQKGEHSYKFTFRSIDDVVGVAVTIEEYASMGGGGSSIADGVFQRSIHFEQLPEGDLTLTFFNLQVGSAPETWVTSWMPQEVRAFAEVTNPDDICWHSSMGNMISELSGQYQGSVMVTQYLDLPQIVVFDLNGAPIHTINNGSWPVYARDGQYMAYQIDNAIIVSSVNSTEEKRYDGYSARDITWSPDNRQIAFANNGEQSGGIYLLDLENGQSRQLTDYGYEYIAGWSVDGNTLYYAIPGASKEGFPLFALNVDSGESSQLFILENSSLKAPYPRVSPDGAWIAYRDRNNSSLHLKSMDGAATRLVMEKPGLAIGNLSWSVNGNWLALNVFGEDMARPNVVMIDPFTCALYQVPDIWGYVSGMIVE